MINKQLLFIITMLIQISLVTKADTISKTIVFDDNTNSAPQINWDQEIKENYSLDLKLPFGQINVQPSSDNKIHISALPNPRSYNDEFHKFVSGTNDPQLLKEFGLKIDQSENSFSIDTIIPELPEERKNKIEKEKGRPLIYPNEILAFPVFINVSVPTRYLKSLKLNGENPFVTVSNLNKNNSQKQLSIEIKTQNFVSVKDSRFLKLNISSKNRIQLIRNEGLIQFPTSKNGIEIDSRF